MTGYTYRLVENKLKMEIYEEELNTAVENLQRRKNITTKN